MNSQKVKNKEVFFDRIKELAKNPDTYRYLLFLVFFYSVFYYGVNFMNAGNSYDQAMAFRPFCIAMGLLVLTLMDVKSWFHFWSLGYLPIWYVVTHVAYEKHWIKDTCEYQFAEVIRAGKLVILVWGLVLIAVIYEMVRKKSWKRIRSYEPVLCILWVLFVVWTAIFQRGYFYINFFLIGFSSLFFVMGGNEKRRKLFFRAFSDAFLLYYVYLIYKTLMHRPYDTERYLAYFANSNMGGMYFACAVCVMFHCIDEWWHSNMRKVIKIPVITAYYLVLGFTLGLAMFNYTRTTILGLLFAFATAFIIQMIKEKKKWQVLLRYVLVLLTAAILFQPTYYVIRYVPAMVNEPSFFEGEYNLERKIKKNDSVDSPKYTTMAQYLRLAFGKWGILINFEEREETGETTVELDNRDVTNGRIGIWKTYLSRTNLTGHYPGHIEMEDGYFCYHAHNTYFHILYQYGLPAGILLLLLAIFSYVYAIYIYIRHGKKEKHLFLALLLTAVCLISQVTEWMGHPAYVICCSYMLMIGMLMTEPRRRIKPEKLSRGRIEKQRQKRR